MTIYAIGDIHGHSAELDRVLDLIERDGGPDAQIVFLGDYTDRGPDSRGVIARLVEGQRAGRPWTFVRGNHDRMFRGFLEDPPYHDPRLHGGLSWRNPRLGGERTLASYGVDGDERRRAADVRVEARLAVPAEHLGFLSGLDLYRETEALLFVHAGIVPHIPLHLQDEDDLLWIRGGFLDDDTVHPWLVVHGHTALDAAGHFGNRVDLDSGAGYGRPLTAAAFEGREAWVLTDRGRLPLPPPATSR